MADKTYFLKEIMSFKDSNSVDTDVELKRISKTFEEGWVKVETVSEHDTKRIFWAKEDNMTEKVIDNKKEDANA